MTKIESKKQKIEAVRQRIKKEQDKISVWQKEIKELEKEINELQNLEIKGIIEEIDMPFEEVMKALKSMKPIPEGEQVEKTNLNF